MNTNATIGATLGIACVALGVLSVALDSSVLGLLAGVGGVAAAALLTRLAITRTVDQQLVQENAAMENVVAEQIRARLDAESRANDAERKLKESGDRREVSRVPAQPNDILHDETTDLFSEAYFGVAVTSRIAAARRHLRPVSVALLDIVEGGSSDDPKATDPTFVARIIRATLREADTACRMDDGRFGVMLEDTPESGAVWTIERLRRAIAEENDTLTLWAGLACYPAHAFDSDEVMTRSAAALESARDWHQDRIEVAVVD